MIRICKTVLTGAAPGLIREQAERLMAGPLRELAARLAVGPGLTVSVITCDDGRAELEVLHTGPPHRRHHRRPPVHPRPRRAPGPDDAPPPRTRPATPPR